MLVLRAQAQAVYSPQQHRPFRPGAAALRAFHLADPALRRSLVHRALLGERRRPRTSRQIAAHVSATDRRAAAAERATLDRYRARLLGSRIGEVFAARVSGVARFGLFVVLAESGTDGLIPLSNLPQDFYRFDPARMRLAGRHSRRNFGLGDALSVRLAEADPLGGRLIFRLEDEAAPPTRHASPRRGARTLRRRRDAAVAVVDRHAAKNYCAACHRRPQTIGDAPSSANQRTQDCR